MLADSLLTLPPAVRRNREIAIFLAVILAGYAIYIVPNVVISVFGIGGGLRGGMFAALGLIQLVGITALVWLALAAHGRRFRDIGLSWAHWRRDIGIGLGLAVLRLLLNFFWIFPATGGLERPDLAQAVDMASDSVGDLLSALVLGVGGGGFTEELFNRGYFIAIMATFFASRRGGLWIAAALSVVIFAAGHLPDSPFMWLELLIPTLLYTGLFLATGRLTASIATHAGWNGGVLFILWLFY